MPSDHATLPRGVVPYRPQWAAAWPRCTRHVGVSGRLEETESTGQGAWRDLERAVEQQAQTRAWLLTQERAEQAAKRCLTTAIRRHGVPENRTIDGSAANEAAIESSNEAPGTAIASRKIPDLHTSVEHAHRGVQRITRPMLGFTSCDAAPATRVGSARMPRRRTGQLADGGEQGLTAAEPFYTLAASSPPSTGAALSSAPPEQNLRQNPLSSMPFCHYDGRRVSLWYLSAECRYTTRETLSYPSPIGPNPTLVSPAANSHVVLYL